MDENKLFILTALSPLIALPLNWYMQNVFVQFVSLKPLFNLPKLFLSIELHIVNL
jgi:hypothetical protein